MLYLFISTHLVINAEKKCIEKGIRYKIIPVPRDFSPDCGMAIEIPDSLEKEFDTILSEENIDFSKYPLKIKK